MRIDVTCGLLTLAILTGGLFIAGCKPIETTVTSTVTATFTQTQTLTPETITEVSTTTINQEVTIPPITETKTLTQTITPAPTTIIRISEDITVTQAYNLIHENLNNPEFVILDVRTSEERDNGYLEGSAWIDIRSDSWLDTVKTLNKSYTYIIYCKVGGRSSLAMESMVHLEFEKVYNMLGGIDGWESDGHPVVKPLPPPTNTTQAATTTPPTTTAGSG